VKKQSDGGQDASALKMFADELKLARAAAGVTQEQLAERVYCHPSLIARIETCRAVPTLDFARRCDEALSTNGVLARMQPQAKRVAFGPGFGLYPQIGKFPPGFGQYLEIEETAATLRYWDPLVVPGMLQTEGYAREVMTGTGIGDTEERITEFVGLRMERQAVLEREDPPQVCVILSLGSLRYEIGSRDVMRGQLEHLIKVAHRPNVALHVVPAGAGAHPGLLGSLVIAGFAGRDRQDVAYLETPLAGWLLEEPEEVARVILLYDTLRGETLPQKASAELLVELKDEWS
jgi:transcriptional regulator with XRE-family HTH domain